VYDWVVLSRVVILIRTYFTFVTAHIPET